MPPKVRVTKKMILDASFDIVRKEGHEKLNVRRIAERLGCSTQPVLYNFKTVDEIREEVYRMADEYHAGYIKLDGQTEQDPLLALGLNYIRFAYEEPHLFRLLFQTNQFGGMDIDLLVNDPRLAVVIDTMTQGIQCDEAEARELFLLFFAVSHGFASLLANNAMDYNEKQSVKLLETLHSNLFPFQKEEF